MPKRANTNRSSGGKVRFRIDRAAEKPFLDQIRGQLINFIHFGTLRSGSRLPTVRQLARDGQINLKTAFKIYQELAREGLVEIRPQSGVFVRSTQTAAEQAYRRSVTEFVKRVAGEAEKLNLSLPRLIHLLSVRQAKAHDSPGVSCAVLECNREQTELFSREIERLLKVRVHPVELNGGELDAEAQRFLASVDFLITTDFHWDEVQRLAERAHKKVFKISLDPAFLQMVLGAARRGPFAMVLTETSFQPRFREAVSAYLTPEELDRIRVIHCANRAAIAAAARECDSVYVSPLCEKQVIPLLGRRRRPRLLRHERMISEDSLRELKENLEFYPLIL